MSNIYLYKKQCNDEMYTKLQTPLWVKRKKWKKNRNRNKKSKSKNRKIETKIGKSKKKSKFRRGLLSDCLLNCYLFKSTLYELINYVLSCNLTTFILKKSFCGINISSTPSFQLYNYTITSMLYISQLRSYYWNISHNFNLILPLCIVITSPKKTSKKLYQSRQTFNSKFFVKQQYLEHFCMICTIQKIT